MSPEQYTYWLNGFVELNGGQMPTPAQWKSIVEHLSTVFTKVTPKYDPNRKICAPSFNEIPYCGPVFPLGVEGNNGQGNVGGGVQTFKMPIGATGDIGNGIQIFHENPHFRPPLGIMGRNLMSDEEYAKMIKGLNFDQTIRTC
jgi:hypothetical protein